MHIDMKPNLSFCGRPVVLLIYLVKRKMDLIMRYTLSTCENHSIFPTYGVYEPLKPVLGLVSTTRCAHSFHRAVRVRTEARVRRLT